VDRASTAANLIPVGVVGAGHVGLATAAVLADWDVPTTVIENDPDRLAALASGRASFFEPELDDLVADGEQRAMLRYGRAVEDLAQCEIVLICVGVLVTPDGAADLGDLESVLDELVAVLPTDAVMAVKSTVPPGTTIRLGERLALRRPDVALVFCPEFLREGCSVQDVRRPARIIVGGEDQAACARVAALFERCEAPTILTGTTSAELIKYGSNAFLATKVSFINELAHFCDLMKADVTEVAAGIGADPRIGTAFLNAGLGFGGSCFPKDVRALEEAGTSHGYTSWLLQACTEINTQQRQRFVAKIADALGGELAGRRVAVLGLAFKPDTDDLREAPALNVIGALVCAGVTVVATDPMAATAAAELLNGVSVVDDPYRCVEGADLVVLATEWPAYRALDWARIRTLMAGTGIVDGRNFLDGPTLAALGFDYLSVGRPALMASDRPAPSPDAIGGPTSS
jgi:UDPglucose 6-dehydrogenase